MNELTVINDVRTFCGMQIVLFQFGSYGVSFMTSPYVNSYTHYIIVSRRPSCSR